MKECYDHTEGSVLKSIVILAWPVMLANLLQTAYNLTDTFWVGRLGPDAVAAVTFCFPVIFLLLSAAAGLTIAGTILVAQYYGKKDHRQVGYVAAQTLMLVTAAGIIISIVGWFGAEHFLRWAGAAPAVLPLATEYLRIIFAGLIFIFAIFVFAALLRGVGEVKAPMYWVGFSVLLNFITDPLLIMGWGPVPSLGVAGAAWATILNRGVAAFAVGWLIVNGRHGIKLRLADFRPDPKVLRQIIRLGIPAGLEHSVRAFSFTLMIFLVGTFGTTVVAAFGVAARMLHLVIIPAVGLAMATSTLVGQNVGAGKPERAARVAYLSAGTVFAVLTVAGLVYVMFARTIVALFIPDDAAVIAIGMNFLRTVAFSFGFLGMHIVLSGALRGAGSTVAALLLTLFNFMIMRFGLAFALSRWTGLAETGIWLAFPVSNVVTGLAALFWFHRGNWRRTGIAATPRPELVEDVA